MRSSPLAALVALALLGVAGCGDDAPATQPLAVPSVTASAAPSPSPTPSAAPSPTPLSPFEADPAVQSLRAHAAAVAQAVNARDLALPALRARVTARRAAQLQDLLGDDLGSHYPGPQPVKVLGVRTLSPTVKRVAACSLEDGWALTGPGGSPVQPDRIAGGVYEMVLEGGTWRIDRALADPSVRCAGLTREDFR